MPQDIRQRAANVMQCRLPWSTALANAEDLDRAGLLAPPQPTVEDLARLRGLAEWLVSKDWMLPALEKINGAPAEVLAAAITRAREALGRTEEG
jgi:hypothetical protein